MRAVRAPLILLGVHPAVVLFRGGPSLVCPVRIHAEAIGRMPRRGAAAMNAPSPHRVHHGRTARRLDAHHAGVFILRDRLFGTVNPPRVALLERVVPFRDVPRPWLTLRRRPTCALAPPDRAGPGRSHDGSRTTSRRIEDPQLARQARDAGARGFRPSRQRRRARGISPASPCGCGMAGVRPSRVHAGAPGPYLRANDVGKDRA